MIWTTHTDERIEHALEKVQATDTDVLRDRVRKLRSECGCRFGALAIVVSIPAVFYIFLQASQPAATKALLIAAVLFGSAATGKIVGLLAARIRLERVLRTVERGARGLASE